jgi:hypothetical protein
MAFERLPMVGYAGCEADFVGATLEGAGGHGPLAFELLQGRLSL